MAKVNLSRTILVVALLALAVIVLTNLYPVGVDWATFCRADIMRPHATEGFISPPWMLLFLPHRSLSLGVGNAVNLILNIAVLLFAIRKWGGSAFAASLVFTSPVFFALALTNNVEWLPLLGLLVNPFFGGVLLSCKPQCLSLAFLIWLKRDLRVAILPLAVLLFSLVVWGWWPGDVELDLSSKLYNFSILPVGIPYGIYLLWIAWREDDAYLAAIATPLFVPYLAPYSLVSVLALLASTRPKAGAWFYLSLWAFTIIEFRRIGYPSNISPTWPVTSGA